MNVYSKLLNFVDQKLVHFAKALLYKKNLFHNSQMFALLNCFVCHKS